jgi:hypothetical protein
MSVTRACTGNPLAKRDCGFNAVGCCPLVPKKRKKVRRMRGCYYRALHASVLTPHKVAPPRELDQRSHQDTASYCMYIDERCKSIHIKAFMSLLRNKITVHLTDDSQFQLVTRQIFCPPSDLWGQKWPFLWSF